jgi:hypothetical protein
MGTLNDLISIVTFPTGVAPFIFTLVGHWIFGWFAYVNEQLAHRQPVDIGTRYR